MFSGESKAKIGKKSVNPLMPGGKKLLAAGLLKCVWPFVTVRHWKVTFVSGMSNKISKEAKKAV